MSDTIKFTQEELDQINLLKDGNSLKISEFGQIELELLMVEQRLNALHQAKETLHKDYQAVSLFP